MKRLWHKLFRRHVFEPYELVWDSIPVTSTGKPVLDNNPDAPKVWYVGYKCSCGEPGFMLGPIDV